MLLRIGVGAGLGGIIGYERDRHRYEKRLDDDKKRLVATLDVEFADNITVPKLIEAIETVRGVRRVVVQQSV
jgi:hypothetical protein